MSPPYPESKIPPNIPEIRSVKRWFAEIKLYEVNENTI
jgi:hypothetical protein